MTFGFPFSAQAGYSLAHHGRVLAEPLPKYPKIDDVLVPLKIQDIAFASEHPERFPKTFGPSAETARTVDRAPVFSRFLAERGLQDLGPAVYDKTHPPKFPCVLKEGLSLWCGYGVHVVLAADVLKRLVAQHSTSEAGCVVQEWVYGTNEYVMHALCRRGELVDAEVRKIDLKTELTRKPFPQAGEPVQIDLEPFRRVFKALEYTGFACPNFKIRPDGRPAIFEINPRLGASLTFPPLFPVLARQVQLAEDTFR